MPLYQMECRWDSEHKSGVPSNLQLVGALHCYAPSDCLISQDQVLSEEMMSPEVTHLSILKKKWKYRGEGNANLVIALPEDRVILRLHKTRRDAPVSEDVELDELRRVCREAYFCRAVMVRLLGAAYIQPPVVARVPHEEIRKLDRLLIPQRPNYRHHKGISFGYVNIYPDYALLPECLTQHTASASEETQVCFNVEGASSLPSADSNCREIDLVLGAKNNPTFCVEIKPKQGWIPNTQTHLTKCTFCLNQYLKLSNGAVSRISQYCPLDLFSGDEKRMSKAMRALLRTPQNNLKIFKEGILVYSDECDDLTGVLKDWLKPSPDSSLVDSFCRLVQQVLTSNLLGSDEFPPIKDEFYPIICPPHIHPTSDHGVKKLQPCDTSSQVLPENCILDRILRIQKLQTSDTNTVYHMLRQDKSCDDYMVNLRDPDTDCLCMDTVQRYLLATTAKDCSILIAFQRLGDDSSVPPQHVVVDRDSGARFVFNIGVSDLDPKPISCVEKHYQRDADIRFVCSQLNASSDPSTDTSVCR
ncbi:inositol-pentakisphosphate 2-kinase isoform X2 [Macrosteles quadrilineatus]|uniref:inositol-pentakisphosphate 2-kinase isoform X2 n=1 Tax=Macrosteles quadrilineatus TaxID=74068 RepID=UPI0023E2653E|nr:inositol-pentakisphosphate 2-kinase isoform X2 [Macrosteles quadrilineatus]